jgi:putative DNA primase/helicase
MKVTQTEDKTAGLQRVIKHCLKSESMERLNAMLESARSEAGIPILPEELNRDGMLLNCGNGTLELRTGKLREHRPEDFITKLCPVAFDPHARCETWLRFLADIFPAGDAAKDAGDGELIGWLQRFLGYCLTGDVREQILPIFWGKGANGKSTLLNVLLEMLGTDYAIKAPTDLLMVKGDAHPTEKADLFGRRLVVCLETEEGRRLAESLVKDLTGGDRIRARRMREDFWEFSPTHKVILCTNHKPRIRGTDHAMWRRIRLVPFTVTIPDDKQDKQLPDKLRAEYPGILAWLVRGCLDWQRQGLGLPEAIRMATSVYRCNEDLLAAFLAECCEIHHALRCRASDLYGRFRRWCEHGGETIPSQRTFGEMLTDRGFVRSTSNGTWYHGIGLRQDEAT